MLYNAIGTLVIGLDDVIYSLLRDRVTTGILAHMVRYTDGVA